MCGLRVESLGIGGKWKTSFTTRPPAIGEKSVMRPEQTTAMGMLRAASAEAGSSGNGSTKKRPRADRDAPKPFKNAYLHFSMVRRSEVAAMYPDWTVQQVSAEVGRLWKALSQYERKPWIELAQFDKARFQTELQQYIDKKRSEEVRVRV